MGGLAGCEEASGETDPFLTLSSTSKRDIEFSVLMLADVLLRLSTRSRVGRGECIGSSASDSLPFFSALVG